MLYSPQYKDISFFLDICLSTTFISGLLSWRPWVRLNLQFTPLTKTISIHIPFRIAPSCSSTVFWMKWWVYELIFINLYYEMKKINAEKIITVKYATYAAVKRKAEKNSGLLGFEPWPLWYRCCALANWASKPTGSFS